MLNLNKGGPKAIGVFKLPWHVAAFLAIMKKKNWKILKIKRIIDCDKKIIHKILPNFDILIYGLICVHFMSIINIVKKLSYMDQGHYN